MEVVLATLPALIMLSMGKLRPTRAAGQAGGGGGVRGPSVSPGKALVTGLCSGVCFVFPNNLGFHMRPGEMLLLEVLNAQ